MPPGAGPPSGTMAWMNFEYVRTGVEPNRPNACVAPAAARLSGPELGPTNRSARRNSAAASINRKSQALTIRTARIEAVKFCARAVLVGPPIKKIVPVVFRPARNSLQAASGQSLSGCEAPIPSTIHGRVQSTNLSPTVINTAGGKCKSGSVDGNGTFISTIKARNQSIG